MNDINKLPRVWDEIIWYFDHILMREVTGRELSWFKTECLPDDKGFYTYNQVELFACKKDLI